LQINSDPLRKLCDMTMALISVAVRCVSVARSCSD
jgi:hypothetical protein